MASKREKIIEQWRGKPWPEARKSGALADILAAFDGKVETLCRELHWTRTGALRDAFRRVRNSGAVVAVGVADTVDKGPLLSDVAREIHRTFQQFPTQLFTTEVLSERLDRSEATVLRALDELRQACFEVHATEAGAVKLCKAASAARSDYTHPGWGETTISLGIISDTHYGNICATEDETEAAYDYFQQEGVAAVLCAGDLMDGPGNLGFTGHAAEVHEEAQTAIQQVAYTRKKFPRRDGITTYTIDSAKSHVGWEFARNGFNMTKALCNGFPLPKVGPDGDYEEWVSGRDDIVYLGLDDRTMRFGPERNTKVHLHHPDGGSAYAISYQPQKWVESLDGGDKPHVAILGHYHKATWLPVRNVQLMSAPCLCWQTPFMRRKRLAAHVGALVLHMSVDAGGDVRRFRFEHLPFYKTTKRHFVVGEAA